jgi:hypothetical protein
MMRNCTTPMSRNTLSRYVVRRILSAALLARAPVLPARQPDPHDDDPVLAVVAVRT